MPDGAEKVFGSLSDRELEILSCMPYDRDGLDEDAMEPQDVKRFIKKYNTPMDFKRMENDFLDFLGAQKLDDEADEEYRVAMESFKEKVYGKRYEYYQQMEVMDNEARGYELKKLSLEEKEEILSETDIDGSSWKVGSQEGFLSVENLKALGLSPNIQMSFENAEIAFSPLFKAGVHDAVIGYVKTFGSDEVMARAFYRSNSQGMWRYLPDYIADYDRGRVAFYGKGGNEEKLSLPMVVQDALAKIYDGVDARNIDKEMGSEGWGELAFVGTARRYGDLGVSSDAAKSEYIRRQTNNALIGDFYRETSWAPEMNFGVLSRKKSGPEELQIAGDLAPDFSDKKREFETDGGMYGKIKIEIFESKDESLEYAICTQKSSGKCWIGGAETKGRITSCGCRESYVSMGDFATPPYEYPTQDGGYGNKADKLGTYYVGMWDNYLSRMPIIQDYLHRHESV